MTIVGSVAIHPAGQAGYKEDGIAIVEAGAYDDFDISFDYGEMDYKILFTPQYPCTGGVIDSKTPDSFHLLLSGISKGYSTSTIFGYLLIYC